jgi:uncharacterized membrane protein YgcG
MSGKTPDIMTTVRRDGTGEVVIDGRSIPIEAADLRAAGKAAVQVVAGRAASLGRPVRMTANSPAGSRILTVHPDGRLTERDSGRRRRALPLAVAAVITLVAGVGAWHTLAAPAGEVPAAPIPSAVASAPASAPAALAPTSPSPIPSAAPPASVPAAPSPAATTPAPKATGEAVKKKAKKTAKKKSVAVPAPAPQGQGSGGSTGGNAGGSAGGQGSAGGSSGGSTGGGAPGGGSVGWG